MGQRYSDSFSSPQDGRHDPGIATAVNYGDNEERLLLSRIGDEIIVDRLKPQRP